VARRGSPSADPASPRLAGVLPRITRPDRGRARTHSLAPTAIWLPVVATLVAGCALGAASATPPIAPGRSDAPREVNLIARDYSFVPATLDLVPGETILLHVIDAGLEVHEAIIGDTTVQSAWETAEGVTIGAPPGPTPRVEVPPDVAGARIVVHSGERVDLVWTVPADAARASTTGGPWLVGCHIPGHWAKGMKIPIRWVIGSTP
jgi:uncharacterized cupredoxin-like copper-binding protein